MEFGDDPIHNKEYGSKNKPNKNNMKTKRDHRNKRITQSQHKH